jgi:hypothetical protein
VTGLGWFDSSARGELNNNKEQAQMSVNIPAGRYQGQVASYEFGPDPRNGTPIVRINMRVTDGPYAGQTAQFKNGFGEKAVKYTKRALLALGWQGKDIKTAADDIAAAKKTVPMEIVIADWEGRQWSSVRSIGAFSDPLGKADDATVKDVNQWLADVGEEEPAAQPANGRNSDLPF